MKGGRAVADQGKAELKTCDLVAALLAMAPGHAFQDRDSWEKVARALEAKVVELEHEHKRDREAYLELVEANAELEQENWQLKHQLDNSVNQLQASIDNRHALHADLVGRIADLQSRLAAERAVNHTLWESLTAEKRHELNVAAQAESERKK